MKTLLLSMIAGIGAVGAAHADPANTQTLSKGEQPVLQTFLTDHGILNAPGGPKGASPVYAKDYQEALPYPAHDRVWSHEKQGYVLRTVGGHNN